MQLLGHTRSRSMIHGGTSSVLALSTLSKSDLQCIQLQHNHTSTTLMAKATHTPCKICCCAVTKPSAAVCYFFAIHAHDWWSMVELLPFSHLPFFQRMTNTTSMTLRANATTTSAVVVKPSTEQGKFHLHCESGIWELAAHRTLFIDSSLGPMFQQQALLKKSC